MAVRIIISLNQILEVIIEYIGKIRFNIVYTHRCITKKALIQLGRCNMGFQNHISQHTDYRLIVTKNRVINIQLLDLC